jgi:hypothetical protein
MKTTAIKYPYYWLTLAMSIGFTGNYTLAKKQ